MWKEELLLYIMDANSASFLVRNFDFHPKQNSLPKYWKELKQLKIGTLIH